MNDLLLIFLLSLIGALGCRESPPFRVVPPASLRTHYLIDFEHNYDSTTLFITSGHLLVFNPGDRDAELTVTAYYEDREPDQFRLRAQAGASTESHPTQWPIRRGGYFALKVESDQPVICQATLGWSNTGGDLFWGAPTKTPSGVRETAKSYMAIPRLARHWYVADAVVIRDGRRHTVLKWLPNATPHTLWIRESEWAVMLNPGDQPAEVTVALHYGADSQEQIVTIPPRRLKRLYMDDIARPNRHYGVAVTSDRDIAVQWLRMVKWHDSPEPMAFWSVPAVPLDR